MNIRSYGRMFIVYERGGSLSLAMHYFMFLSTLAPFNGIRSFSREIFG